MGETSKKRGEFGEDIVERLLTLIGWDNLLTGRDLECFNPIEHSISTRDRANHGVDFIYQYDCPLFSDTQMFILTSSKFNDKYPSNPTSKFKAHLRDIAYALDCFKKSSIRSKLKNTDIRYTCKQTGVIFWLDNSSSYDNVLERLTDFKIDDSLQFDTVYLVDNHRARFIHDTITFAKRQFSGKTVEFFHPTTGFNNTVKNRISSSDTLPVQYINSSILPLKVIDDESEYLIINCIDKFEEDTLRKLLSLSQKLTENWGQKVYILFPDFNHDMYSSTVEDIKLELKDKRFAKKVIVSSFNITFRTVEQF
ncbi:GapS4a family protein [Hymenobacter volaticus]|uniref:GAPS4 PD-(D/E)XK nuclease domain-containing protein n=1 Tax=Hymenobacter volaticus TaxID=2932254 RepID=A0ABY4G0U1_9BACT|nr:hypothetical protein [Hymenobacter volaticus]UOQ64472.1 hypothetical protein MUN86_12820 [Hymenobacter volaticus]